MIQLRNVTKTSILDQQRGKEAVLREASLAFPLGGRIALFGPGWEAVSIVLHLLAGSINADKGEIIRPSLRWAPVINGAGIAGSPLAWQLTGVQNINFFARVHGIDPLQFVHAIELTTGLGRVLSHQVGALTWPQRRALEAAIVAILPYDCYFVDCTHQVEGDAIWQVLNAAHDRGATVFFALQQRPRAVKLGYSGLVLHDGSLRYFPAITEASAYHEQFE